MFRIFRNIFLFDYIFIFVAVYVERIDNHEKAYKENPQSDQPFACVACRGGVGRQ